MNKKVKLLEEEYELVRVVGATAIVEKDGKRLSVAASVLEDVKEEPKKKAAKKPTRKNAKKK